MTSGDEATKPESLARELSRAASSADRCPASHGRPVLSGREEPCSIRWRQSHARCGRHHAAPHRGTFQAYGDGTLPAELFNEGPSGDYVAADAIAYVLNPHCQAENGATNAFGSAYTSSIIGPGSGPPGFSTTNDWYLQAGHGYANHELWTHTNGATPVSTATWVFSGSANACYTASAYIPDNYADNTSAAYTISTQKNTISTSINQANSTGWTQFAGNPKITTGSNGQVTVTLNDTGPDTSSFTAADAISFIQTGC